MSWLQQKAFTLIETTILLVIIGLIVLGFLVGKDLLASAKNRALIRQVESFDIAVSTFYRKYGALPGDFSNAEEVLGCKNCNGNGDGFITDDRNNIPARKFNGEIARVWQHLGLAGLVDITYDEASDPLDGMKIPYAKTGLGMFAILSMPASGNIKAGNYIAIGGGDGLTAVSKDINGAGGFFGAVTGAKNGLTPAEAFAIDSKVDDGNANTGFVHSVVTSAGSKGANKVCHVNAGGGKYNLASKNNECSVIIKLGDM